jgi:arylsulfatase A-like enzyme
MWNVGAYTHGMMGQTPNIDRIAKEGMLFTDHYAHPSCTAGRAAFITGQLPVRTGLTTIGIPGSKLGLQKEDPTLAEVLKPLGYTTGQFGKNHLGDRNEFLPTVHGFDEFYGNLYHLNAEEEPEQLDYPRTAWSNMTATWASCWICSMNSTLPTTPSFSTAPTTAPRSSPGPTAARPPSTARKRPAGKAASASLRQCAGPERSRPARWSTASSPTLTGRRPCWRPPAFPTSSSAAQGAQSRGQDLQGPPGRLQHARLFQERRRGRRPRQEIFYFTDIGEMAAVRHGDVKVHFLIQEAHGFDVWKNPYTPQGWPSMVNLRSDPFERAMHESIGWADWSVRRMYALSGAAVIATEFMKTFLDYPAAPAAG